MVEKAGIKETKELFHFIFSVVQASVEAATEGKSAPETLAKLAGPLVSFPAAIAGISQVPSELSDLSAAEKAELYALVEQDLHIPNELADLIVKKVWKIVLEFSDFVKVLKK